MCMLSIRLQTTNTKIRSKDLAVVFIIGIKVWVGDDFTMSF